MKTHEPRVTPAAPPHQAERQAGREATRDPRFDAALDAALDAGRRRTRTGTGETERERPQAEAPRPAPPEQAPMAPSPALPPSVPSQGALATPTQAALAALAAPPVPDTSAASGAGQLAAQSPAAQALGAGLPPQGRFALAFPPHAWPLLRAEGTRGRDGLALRITADARDAERLRGALSALRASLEASGERVVSLTVEAGTDG